MTETTETVTAEQVGPKVKPVHTPCKNCVFAQYNWDAFEEGRKPTQTGCKLKKLEVFYARGSEDSVLEAEDEQAEFFIVNGRRCQFFRDRNSEWAKTVPYDQYEVSVRREVIQRVDFVIVLDAEDGDDVDAILERVQVTLDSIKGQTIRPNKVFIVSNHDAVRPGKLQVFIDRQEGLNIFRTDIHLRAKNGNRIARLACVDEAISKCNGHFYVLARPGFTFPAHFILDIDRSINDDLERFLLLRPVDNELNAMVVHRGFHKDYDGHAPGWGTDPRVKEGDQPKVLLRNMLQKASYLVGVYEQPYLLKDVTEVCSSLPR